MFIVSKRNFLIHRPGREPFAIRKNYVGEIPEDVAAHWLVKEAIRSGAIAAAAGRKDAQLEAADVKASERAASADIRPDAQAGKEAAAGKRSAAK